MTNVYPGVLSLATFMPCLFHFVGEGATLRSIAVVIATIIGMGPSSGYLWTNLFEPMKLKDTYIPGFLVRDLPSA